MSNASPSSASPDDLLGFLIGALEPHEHQQVELALSGNPSLRRDLEFMQQGLLVLEADREHHVPPDGLATQTTRYVWEHVEVMPASLSPSARTEVAPARGWRVADLAVAAGIFVAASLLFFPAINSSRMNAQIATCQNNLRLLWGAAHHWSELDERGAFPVVPASNDGQFAAAGVVAPLLMEAGLLTEAEATVCPADTHYRELVGPDRPTLADYRNAVGEERNDIAAQLGGSYGYPLGHLVNGAYEPIVNQSRETFPLFADSPADHHSGSHNHGGGGHNVVFEDGHLAYVKDCCVEDFDDNMFLNKQGELKPGVDLHDAVIVGPWKRLKID